MNTPPYKCLFCSTTTTGLFTRIEHPIPESLGNDSLLIEPGYICDSCNQYFGVKVESYVLNAPPFGIERVSANVKTKKGKFATFSSSHINLYPTGFKDSVFLTAPSEYLDFVRKKSLLVLPYSAKDDTLLARFLLKVGLELLLTANEHNPYDSKFDSARNFARSPDRGAEWQVAYGLYPKPDDLNISWREDEISPLVTHQLYQYQIGEMQNGDLIFSFMYMTHYYACNLTRPSISNYKDEFNFINDFKLRVINAKNL
jgi:hypothetical protein